MPTTDQLRSQYHHHKDTLNMLITSCAFTVTPGMYLHAFGMNTGKNSDNSGCSDPLQYPWHHFEGIVTCIPVRRRPAQFQTDITTADNNGFLPAPTNPFNLLDITNGSHIKTPGNQRQPAVSFALRDPVVNASLS